MVSLLARAVPGLLLAALALAGCASDSDTAEAPTSTGGSAGQLIDIDGAEALQWGAGGYGVVLAHGAAFDAASWEGQATAIADQGATVIAVEDISPESIGAAVSRLQDDGVQDVALVGGSAGADAIPRLAVEQLDLADQLILLSANATVEGLGEEPKLFIASEDEPLVEVSTELAATAPGEDNEVRILPGSAHAQNIFDSDEGRVALDAVLERLKLARRSPAATR